MYVCMYCTFVYIFMVSSTTSLRAATRQFRPFFPSFHQPLKPTGKFSMSRWEQTPHIHSNKRPVLIIQMLANVYLKLHLQLLEYWMKESTHDPLNSFKILLHTAAFAMFRVSGWHENEGINKLENIKYCSYALSISIDAKSIVFLGKVWPRLLWLAVHYCSLRRIRGHAEPKPQLWL